MTLGSDDPRFDEIQIEELDLPPLEPDEPRKPLYRPPLAVVLSLVLLAGVVVVLHREDTRHVFGKRTGDVLAFNDGFSGLVMVDLDHRKVVRRYIDPRIAGFHSVEFFKDGYLIVAAQAPFLALNLRTGKQTTFGEGENVVPAFERARVWVFEFGLGVPFNDAPPSWFRLSSFDGRTIKRVKAPDFAGGFPLAAVPNGVVYETGNGSLNVLHVSGRITKVFRGQLVWLGISSARTFAWCAGSCHVLHIGFRTTVRAPAGSVFDTTEGYLRSHFSPNGRYIAVPYGRLGRADNALRNVHLALIDVATGKLRTLASLPSSFATTQWSADSERVYTLTADGDHVAAGDYDLGDGFYRTARVPSRRPCSVALPNRAACSCG
jgi:hypothetical protein